MEKPFWERLFLAQKGWRRPLASCLGNRPTNRPAPLDAAAADREGSHPDQDLVYLWVPFFSVSPSRRSFFVFLRLFSPPPLSPFPSGGCGEAGGGEQVCGNLLDSTSLFSLSASGNREEE